MPCNSTITADQAHIMHKTFKQGETAPEFELPSVAGGMVSLRDFVGKKSIVIFNRCINCPFSILSLQDLQSQIHQLEDEDVSVIMIFPSSIETLRKSIDSSLHSENLFLLADESMKSYKDYKIPSSIIGELRTLLAPKKLVKALGQISSGVFSMKGNLLQMPGSFLIDEFGMIDEVKIGKTFSDLISIDKIRDWCQSSLQVELGNHLELLSQLADSHCSSDTLLISYFEKE